ncbi:GNAT family N-acetyltransferase [Pseudomonas sp. S1(2024)]|uniref:GNAT family N-acetyltransferase n=1 Tax=Pseudomonas sp. S1(2024) TaxID=3390191 RepID=UPI0039782A81
MIQIIDISNEGGALSGYIVDASQPNLENYLGVHTSLSKAIMLHLRQRGERVALLANLYVEEACRGQGHGGELVDRFCQEAEAGGATAYLLICDEAETQLDGFELCQWYEAFGFCTVFKTSQGPLMVVPEALCNSLAEFLGVGAEPDEAYEP